MVRFIEIRLTKYKLFLTQPELVNLLSRDPALWAEAIRRGKRIKRGRAAERRKNHDR
jgi:hypothetical protein